MRLWLRGVLNSGGEPYEPFPILLTVPTVPGVEADTGVVAEDPVGDTIELTVPSVPGVDIDAAITAFALSYDAGYGYDHRNVFTLGGTASASDPRFSSPAGNAIDGSTSTYYETRVMGSTWSYDHGEGNEKTWRSFRLYNSFSYRMSNVVIEGSNNESDWDELIDQALPAATGWQEYDITNTTAYRYYRLTMSGSSRIYFYEFEAYQYTIAVLAAIPELTHYEIDSDVEVAADPGFEYPGHSFDGWNTAIDGTGDSYAPEDDITMDAPYTLYAQWAED